MIGELSANRRTWIAAILITGVAAWLRLAALPDVPFGWHPDEATKALLARDVLAGKYFPAFFSAFTGREALYVYLEAFSFALLGERIVAARLLSAFLGVLTVALTYATGKRLFNRRMALFAAVFMAASLWHLIASRNGYRAVLQPLVQLPVILLLFEGWRARKETSPRPFVIAGLWLGVTQYSYTAARLFPLLLIGVVVCAALIRPAMVWSRRRGFLLMLLVSLFVFLPLGLHFLQNPIDFYGRAAQISVFSPEWAGGDSLARFWQSVKETARMFTVWGDINFRFNVAGEPVFGAADGILFYAGLLLSLWRLTWKRGLQRVAHITVLLWLAVMVLPMTLSAESLPYFQRAIGVLPVVYYFPALALDCVLTKLGQSRLFKERALAAAGPILALALLAWLGTRTYVDYFETWHKAPRNDDDRRVAMVYAADYLKQAGPPETLFLSSQYVQHPTLALLAPEHYDQVQWFDASQSLPLPAEGVKASYLMLLENGIQGRLLEAAPGLQPHDRGFDRFGRAVFEVFRWPGAAWPTADDTSPAVWSWEVNFEQENASAARNQIALPVNFDDVIAFRGHNRAPQQVQPGDSLEIVLFWEILGRPERQYTFFVHLLDASSQVVAGYDANTYATTFWPDDGGELLLSYFPLSVPGELAAGEYQLEIGVYHQPSGERLPVLQDGRSVADRLLLEPVIIDHGE